MSCQAACVDAYNSRYNEQLTSRLRRGKRHLHRARRREAEGGRIGDQRPNNALPPTEVEPEEEGRAVAAAVGVIDVRIRRVGAEEERGVEEADEERGEEEALGAELRGAGGGRGGGGQAQEFVVAERRAGCGCAPLLRRRRRRPVQGRKGEEDHPVIGRRPLLLRRRQPQRPQPQHARARGIGTGTGGEERRELS